MIIREKYREYDLDITDNTCCVIASFSELAKSLPFYMYCAGHIFGLKNCFAKTWYLKGYLMLVTTGGTGEFIYREKRYELSTGDVVFFDCTEYHEYRTLLDTWDYFYIRLDGPSAKTYADHINGDGLFIYRCEDLEKMSEKCDRCIDLCISSDDNSLFEIADLLSSMITETAMHRNKALSPGMSDSVTVTKEYIDHNFRQNVSLDKLAETVHSSKYHLCRSFSEQFGMTPHRYLSYLRIAEAKRLLITTRKTVSEIGDAVGYNNTNVFIRNFKKSEGMSPLTFRNMNTY